MKIAAAAAAVLLMQGLAFPPEGARAQDMVVAGQAEYAVSCANCHGVGGKGDGPFAPILTLKPADLTQLAARNGGQFPDERIYRIIDGRLAVEGHGPGEMPIWGDIYLDEARTVFGQRYGRGEAENFVTERILALIGYLRTLQE